MKALPVITFIIATGCSSLAQQTVVSNVDGPVAGTSSGMGDLTPFPSPKVRGVMISGQKN